jgi:hypothetical protein
MFDEGKSYKFTLWRDDRKEGEPEVFETGPYQIHEVDLPLIRVWDRVTGTTIINTASISFISASVYIDVEDDIEQEG